jgi:glycine betaine/proline transport system substrate-binding protein
VPKYLVDAHPELATWQGLNQDAAMFATTESGNQGQLLDGDSSYTTYDGEIIKALGLNYKVVYAGSETAEITALKQASAKQAPILMYFWTPHWAVAKYNLVPVKLPDVTPACDTAAANGGAGYACAYPQDTLYKAFNADLQTNAPQAFALLSAMNFTNDDQNAMGVAIAAGGDPATVVKKWMADNPSTWQPWMDAATAVQPPSS